ncbi:MAG: membrane protein insertase YidC [Chitinophagaceae bacterium]|nr:membrane protein insertase YidC [Chitinophagaceae bacterium]
MDRQQITGLILIGGLTLYIIFFSPKPEVQKQTNNTEQKNKKDSTSHQNDKATLSQNIQVDTTQQALFRQEQFGIFSPIAHGIEKEINIENEDLHIIFSNKGGTIKQVTLKKYTTYTGTPLIIFDAEKSIFQTHFTSFNKAFAFTDFFFIPQEKKITSDTTQIIFRAYIDAQRYIEQTYTIPQKGYLISYSHQLIGLSTDVSPQNVAIHWKNNVAHIEKDINDLRARTFINYYTTEEEKDELGDNSVSLEQESIDTPLKWISFKQKFFSTALIPKEPFQSADISTKVDEQDPNSAKQMIATIQINPKNWTQEKFICNLFFGPNEYNTLKEIAPDFSSNIDFGWAILKWINKGFMLPIFHFLETITLNHGIIIIILVVLIRIILLPLTYHSFIGMAKMRILKPEIDQIKEKYPDDLQKQQVENMNLYKQVGVNPLSGCIPMLLQLPILFAMFYFFPNIIELRQKPFLWAEDLSTYDSIASLPFSIPFYGSHVSLFTLLMTASSLLLTWFTNQMTTVQGPMKVLQYIAPIMFLGLLNSYSAGLSFYYFVSNIASVAQQELIRKLINEKKIRKKLDENRKKNQNKNKSSFQLKIEDAMKKAKDKKNTKGGSKN